MFRALKSALFILVFAIFLSSCSGGSTETASKNTGGGQKNQPPSISGTIPANIVADQRYNFTPTATDPDGDTLTFAIKNKPDWATFDSNTGNLSGIPGSQDVGTYNSVSISVSDSKVDVSLDPTDITVEQPPSASNQAPEIVSQTLSATINLDLQISLGPLVDNDGDNLVYTVSNTSNTRAGKNPNEIIFNSQTEGTETFSVSVSDGVNPPVVASITVNVKGPVTSKYVTGRDIIPASFGSAPPAKGETRVDPITGTRITRLTDATELPGTSDALIVYSRYSPENTSGQYFLAFGANSTSSWVIERATGQIVAKLRYDATNQIGENHEVRWDTSGQHPNRVYFVQGMKFYMIDDVTNQDNTRTVIKDFTNQFPASTQIYNDVEGDSSLDSDNWAWMASHYNGVTFVVDAFVHFQISTKTMHSLKTTDLMGTPLEHYASSNTFPRPNMVEVSPSGSGIILHYGRAWGTPSYGSRSADIDTWFDGAYLWPLDFNYNNQVPVKVSVGETHSGWAFDASGSEYFISQNNRTDKLDAIKDAGSNSGYNNRVEVASHSDFGWSNNFHYGKMPASKSGWIFINTYASSASNATEWAANQLIIMQLKAETNNPTVWRIGSNYNKYSGDYRDEAPAAMNLAGNRIYLSNNWGGMLNHREVFVFELPDNWQDNL